jgi:hypothetical protein
VDETVAPGEAHTYAVRPLDGHFNMAAAGSVAVTIPKEQLTALTTKLPPIPVAPGPPRPDTPPAAPPGRQTAAHAAPAPVTDGTPQGDSGGGLDPRRTGVRVNGSYWGDAGEAIDAVSGNLNFSIPLLNPTGRNGAKTTIVLSYNSQIWRKDSGGVTLLGQDTGFGVDHTGVQCGGTDPPLPVHGRDRGGVSAGRE